MKKIQYSIRAIALTFWGMDRTRCADLPASKPPLNRPHDARRHVIAVPPERHVVEVVEHAHSNRMIINGQWFAAATVTCAGWIAGDRVVFGQDTHSHACVDTVVRNASRYQTCEMRCGGPAYDW